MEVVLEQSLQPKTKENILEEVVGQELFLYDDSSDTAYCTNSGAALIWLLCDGTRSIKAIAGEIAATFDLPEQQVLNEVKETIERFFSMGLLETEGPGPT